MGLSCTPFSNREVPHQVNNEKVLTLNTLHGSEVVKVLDLPINTDFNRNK